VEERGRPDPWASFQHDPRDPAIAPLRASDADRDVIHRVLADAFADGRIDREEYEERSGSVLSARTLGELPPLVRDLVPDRPLLPARMPLAAASSSELQRRAEDHWREERRNALFGFLGPTVICWTIWAVVMPGDFPWPAFVMAATFLNVLRVVAGRREIVASEFRRLEKKRAKEQAKEIGKKQEPDS